MNLKQTMAEAQRTSLAANAAGKASAFGFHAAYDPAVVSVFARVTGNTVITADLKWSYNWEEVRFTESTRSVAAKTNGLNNTQAGVAYNWTELANTATMWAPLGNPANVPAGFKLKPIATNTPVILYPVRDTTGKAWWVFQLTNAIDGECP